MENNLARKAVDFFLKNKTYKNEDYLISFIGGEPLLNLNLIKDIFNYAKNKYHSKRIDFLILTNGSLLNKDIAAFIKSNNIKIRVTFHKDESVCTYLKIKRLFANYKNIGVGIVINSQNTNKLFKIFKDLFAVGFRRFYFLPEFISSKWSGEKLKILQENLRNISAYFIKNNARDIFINYISSGDHQLRYVSNKGRNNGKEICIIRELKNRNFIVMPNGDVFSCNIGVFTTDPRVYLKNRLGNIKDGFSLSEALMKMNNIYAGCSRFGTPCLKRGLKTAKIRLSQVLTRERDYVFNR